MARPLENIPVTNVGDFFESVKGLYIHFAKNQINRNFELWELINEGWIKTRSLNEDSVYKSKAIKWGILSYKYTQMRKHAHTVATHSCELDERIELEAPREVSYEDIEALVHDIKKLS